MFSLHIITSYYSHYSRITAVIQNITVYKVIKNKKATYWKNRAQGITPLTIEELTQSNESGISNQDDTIAGNLFKGYRDDLDFNDENDVGTHTFIYNIR